MHHPSKVVVLPVISFHTLGEIAPVTAMGTTASVLTVVVVVVFSVLVAPVTSNSYGSEFS